MTGVKWLAKPENHDYEAAENYLSLLMKPAKAADLRQKLSAKAGEMTHRQAKDILRASQLALLSQDNKHVAADLQKVASGAALSPILLIRGSGTHPLIVADGYHRVCASYWLDENTNIPCVLVLPPTRLRGAPRRRLPSSLLRRSSVQATPRPFGSRGPRAAPRPTRQLRWAAMKASSAGSWRRQKDWS